MCQDGMCHPGIRCNNMYKMNTQHIGLSNATRQCWQGSSAVKAPVLVKL